MLVNQKEKNEGKQIEIGIPKGSLFEHTLKVFKSAGFDIGVLERKYTLAINDPEIKCFLLRPQEIPRYIAQGKLDLGISGDDWIIETGTKEKVKELCDLKYAKQEIKRTKWVLAVPRDSSIKSVKDLEGKTISTEIINIVKRYLAENKVKAKVEFSFGAAEVKPPKFVDAIIDITETGESLRANNLKIIDTILESSTKLIANKKSWEDNWKREKMQELTLLLKGAVDSEKITGIAMHVPKEKLEEVLEILPSLKKPTVTKIANIEWYDIFGTANRKEIKELFPKLKRMGCSGIIEFPLNKVVV